jgi:hypothetical protein
MNCLDARRALGAEPAARTPELEGHLTACAGCARHAAELARVDALILRALRVPVPDAAIPAAPVAPARRWRHALAAGLAAAALLAGVWAVYPRDALATSLVAHMGHEPQAWVRTEATASPPLVARVLASAGVTLDPSGPPVSYAMSCFFRGRYVPHIVVQTAAGPMTVMILAREHVAARATFDEGGFRGVILPAAHGSLAVLARAGVAPAAVDDVSARVAAALHYGQ